MDIENMTTWCMSGMIWLPKNDAACTSWWAQVITSTSLFSEFRQTWQNLLSRNRCLSMLWTLQLVSPDICSMAQECLDLSQTKCFKLLAFTQSLWLAGKLHQNCRGTMHPTIWNCSNASDCHFHAITPLQIGAWTMIPFFMKKGSSSMKMVRIGATLSLLVTLVIILLLQQPRKKTQLFLI